MHSEAGDGDGDGDAVNSGLGTGVGCGLRAGMWAGRRRRAREYFKRLDASFSTTRFKCTFRAKVPLKTFSIPFHASGFADASISESSPEVLSLPGPPLPFAN